jgi:opacity protein-like surface antigen
MLRRLLFCSALLFSSAGVLAQVVPSGYFGQHQLTTGGFYSYFDADYASNHMTGVGTYVDWTPPMFMHIGVEGEARWLMLSGANNFREYNYLAGPRYAFQMGRRMRPYAKVLAGAGEIDFPYHLAHGGYLAIAPGGGVDYALGGRWRVRADYEYQIWPKAVGIPNIPSSVLKPNGVSVGISFAVFRGRTL